ncbi:MAG: ABC transporter ATP-binding protein [Anaerolinea sp.]|nr:ABC transporter ATP-binding protein [Anaerolinea sp.]
MADTPILVMKGIRKTFDKSVALDDVSFELNAREIHGLLGGNGAGKTTLMNILYGLYKKDSGEISLHEKKINISSPRDALHKHIGMVHQHFLQITSFTVLENIVLGTEIHNKYSMDLSVEATKIQALQNRFNLAVDLNISIGDLPMGTRQKVEILKALYRGAEILILDEPTTNLTPQEVDDLFKSLRVMVDQDLSIVFITHKLREVLSVCDRISVLRNGRNVVTLKRDEANEEAFVRGMVGDEMDIQNSVIFSRGKSGQIGAEHIRAEVCLHLDQVQLASQGSVPRLKDISFKLRHGEILGIAGVAGNGQRDLAEVILGITLPTGGKVELDAKDILAMPTNQRLESGIAYIPEDRLLDGFLPKASVAHNLILGFHRKAPYSSGGFINWNTVHRTAAELIKTYNIKTSGPSDVGGNLSGGNIQRVLIARAFSKPANLLVAHNPTRGLDIPSMDFVYSRILEEKKKGLATLLISEDLDELLLLCDRIAVLYRGELVGTLDRSKFEKYEIGRMMSGYRAEE